VGDRGGGLKLPAGHHTKNDVARGVDDVPDLLHAEFGEARRVFITKLIGQRLAREPSSSAPSATAASAMPIPNIVQTMLGASMP
jgi:hypothetical protein